MTPYQREQIENIRRAAERGKNIAEQDYNYAKEEIFWKYIDTYQHILDLVEVIKQK
jgi:hypothetical protein